MRLASYLIEGTATFGAVVDGGVIDLPPRLNPRFNTLRELLAGNAVAGARAAIAGATIDRPLSAVRLLPVIPDPDKIICAGINYRVHAEETGRNVPTRPSMFLRMRSTLLAEGEPMLRPCNSTAFDFEGELAVIIGKSGRMIAAENAMEHVAGYSCFVDGSVRDYQKFSVTSGKNFNATGPLGPWMITADEVEDPADFVLTTRLNGTTMQHSGVDRLIHSVPELVAFASEFTRLLPGDIIATGTPDGVGHRRQPPVWMKPGDRLEVEISNIGVLHSPIADEPA